MSIVRHASSRWSACWLRRKQAISQGYTKVGLVSAAVSDHTQIDDLATELQRMGASISASSMRMDPISVPLIRALAATGAQNLTVAPEAGSQRLRNVINKTQTEEQMMAAINLAQELNFPQLKLYFMVGHPTETDEDIQALIDFTLEARKRFKRRIAINATPFVPKAHTPFQWEGMTDSDTLRGRQRTIHKALARHGVDVRADSPDWAEVQAVLSRGDRRLGQCVAGDPAWRAVGAQLLPDPGRFGAGEGALHRPLGDRRRAALGGGAERRQRELLSLRTAAGQPEPDRAELPTRLAGCLACQACDQGWAFRYGDNSKRPVPAAKGGPWRAEDWAPWTHLKQQQHEIALTPAAPVAAA
jgi:hypothetical protein